MTFDERNSINDRERIKQFLENTMRRMCDDMCDKELDMVLLDNAMEIFNKLSVIYKNMGFDKEGGKNERNTM